VGLQGGGAVPVIVDLGEHYRTLWQAHRESGWSIAYLRKAVDSGAVKSVRDPLGRRLILAVDVARLREERERYERAQAERNGALR
jgi:hypothetical protein